MGEWFSCGALHPSLPEERSFDLAWICAWLDPRPDVVEVTEDHYVLCDSPDEASLVHAHLRTDRRGFNAYVDVRADRIAVDIEYTGEKHVVYQLLHWLSRETRFRTGVGWAGEHDVTHECRATDFAHLFDLRTLAAPSWSALMREIGFHEDHGGIWAGPVTVEVASRATASPEED